METRTRGGGGSPQTQKFCARSKWRWPLGCMPADLVCLGCLVLLQIRSVGSNCHSACLRNSPNALSLPSERPVTGHYRKASPPPWARKQVISSFLAQGKRRSCVITNGLNILCSYPPPYMSKMPFRRVRVPTFLQLSDQDHPARVPSNPFRGSINFHLVASFSC